MMFFKGAGHGIGAGSPAHSYLSPYALPLTACPPDNQYDILASEPSPTFSTLLLTSTLLLNTLYS